jgi:hypothetical protein
MWSSVLALALLMTLNPVRLGLILLMISRPRPLQNLLAYWVGGLTVAVPLLLAPLMMLHFTPVFRSGAHGSDIPATSSTVRHIQIGIGLLALSIAAVMTVRFLARQRVQLPAAGNNASAQPLESSTPIQIQRLLGRVHNAWESGSLWVAWLIGLVSVSMDGVVFVAAIIAASGAAIGTQISAAIVFLIGIYAVVEVILVAYLAAPAKTEAMLRRVHDWAHAHRHQVLIAIFTVVGVSQLAQGTGIV